VKNQRGQVVVEYVLLLIVLIAVAAALMKGLVGTQDNKGAVLKTWSGLLTTIAEDIPDRVGP
jgi:hypothetical protein